MRETIKILFGLYWLEISVLALFLVIAFVLEQKFNFKKPRQYDHPLVLRLFMPNFVTELIDIMQQIPFLSFIYLSLGYGFFIRYKVPGDRLVRYNIMYSIMLVSLQGIINEMFISFTEAFIISDYLRSQVTLMAFFCWLSLYIPCFIRALLGKYDENKFIREAVEVHLGRDGPDFIWWDRVRKDKAPKRPPLN